MGGGGRGGGAPPPRGGGGAPPPPPPPPRGRPPPPAAAPPRGLHQDAIKREADLVFVVRAMDVDFRAPARLDDQLSVSVRLLECRGASFVMVQRIERDGALLVEAKVKIAALRASSFRPCPLPDFLSSQLKPPLETP